MARHPFFPAAQSRPASSAQKSPATGPGSPHPARTRPGLLRVRSPRRPLPHRASGPPASLSRTPALASLPSRCLAGPTSQGRPLPRATAAPGTPKFPAGFPSRARTPRYPAPSFKSPRDPPRNPSRSAAAAVTLSRLACAAPPRAAPLLRCGHAAPTCPSPCRPPLRLRHEITQLTKASTRNPRTCAHGDFTKNRRR